jgi:GNAT superfamily N-acetyltransferase
MMARASRPDDAMCHDPSVDQPPEIHTAPLEPARWDDFATLCRQMGPNRSCWCMWWREVPDAPRTATRREASRQVVDAGPPPGVLAYCGGRPVGWAAAGPRRAYPRLEGGRDTRAEGSTDGVWALPCFFVPAEWRGRGIARRLLDAAVDLAVEQGAVAIDAVPVDPTVRARTASASYTGTLPMFLAAGFEEIARRTPKGRVVVRLRRGHRSGTRVGTAAGS